ncbi:MAG: aspartate aminotransferase family protein [Ponticaulis sp.]|nr:aspartate aminotransferase family protein [Ponticaulis sp.]
MQNRNETKVLLDQVKEQVIRYVSQANAMRVSPDSKALAGLAMFDEELSTSGRDAVETLELMDKFGSPATVANTGGRFFGLVTGGTLPVALAANWLATAWDQLGFSAITSPVSAKLEEVASQWCLQVLGLPHSASLNFVTGTSAANFTCLVSAQAALLDRLGYDLMRDGLRGAPRIRVVTSDDIHATVMKALTLIGIGLRDIERVPTDAQGRMVAEKIPELDSQMIVICQAGNVNSGSFDPFDDICARANSVGAWVHVDGAFGLWATASPQLRHLTKGIEKADSWGTDGHKWLNTPYDCGLAICRNVDDLKRTMSFQTAYTKIVQSGVAAPITVLEMSRRARGIDIWATLRTLGRKGVADLLDRTCAHARALSSGLESMGFEILNDVVLNQVVAAPPDGIDPAALASMVQKTGECWFGPTNWKGRPAIRISVSNWQTTDADVKRSLSAIRDVIASLPG